MYVAALGLGGVLATWVLGLFSRPWSVPYIYNGDALSGGASFKAVLETGWYEHNTSLNAPVGQEYHSTPIPDNMAPFLVKVVGLFTDDWVVASNAVFVLGFALAAACGAYFFRVVGVHRLTALAFGLLFAFAPYHFVHGYAHLALSVYFALALAAAVAVRAMANEPIWLRREGPAWRAWLTGRSLMTALGMVALGGTAVYYTVFLSVVLAFVGLVLLARRRFKAIGGLIVAGLFLMGSLFVNLLPDLLYRGPHNYMAFARSAWESEIYALKFAALVFPVPWSRIGSWGEFRLDYQGVYPLPSESPSLGLVAAAGFVFLIVLGLLSIGLTSRRFAAVEDGSFWARQRHLSMLTWVAFMFGTVGGFATLFAVFVSPSVRAWNRIVILIMLFALASAALLLDAGLRRLLLRWRWSARRGTAITALAAVLVTSFGLYDQVAPAGWGRADGERADWSSDLEYGAALEEALPDQALVLEAPFMEFPESQPVNDMFDYQPLRPYLATSGLRWTYGGFKGIPSSAWSQRLLSRPAETMLAQAAVAGVAGFHIDSYGFPGRDSSSLIETVERVSDRDPIVSPDGRFTFVDIQTYAEEVRSTLGPETTAAARKRILYGPQIFSAASFFPASAEGEHSALRSINPSGTLTIGNPLAAMPVRMTFLLRVEDAARTTAVDVVWPDGERETYRVPGEGQVLPVQRTFTLPTGESTLTVAQDRSSAVSLIDLSLVDLTLKRQLKPVTDASPTATADAKTP